MIAIKKTTLDLDRDEKDVIEVDFEIEFVTLDELKEMDEIFNSTEENDDWYFSDFKWAEEDIFYVEIYRVTEECQEIVEEVIDPAVAAQAKKVADAIEAVEAIAEVDSADGSWAKVAEAVVAAVKAADANITDAEVVTPDSYTAIEDGGVATITVTVKYLVDGETESVSSELTIKVIA